MRFIFMLPAANSPCKTMMNKRNPLRIQKLSRFSLNHMSILVGLSLRAARIFHPRKNLDRIQEVIETAGSIKAGEHAARYVLANEDDRCSTERYRQFLASSGIYTISE